MRQNNDEIVVKISRFGAETKTVNLEVDSTVEEALAEAGITLGNSETAWVNGVEAKMSFLVDDGDTIQLVGKKEGGLL